jgi:hypothetical protein
MGEEENAVGGANRRFLLLLFVAALALRLAAVFAMDTPSAARGATTWQGSHEPGCLAMSMLEGRGYGDPWCKGSGPSSWLTPAYPSLLALLFSIFGGVSVATALALHVLQSVASAVTCVLLVPLGRAFGLARAGKLAAWIFALYPVAISNAAQLVWDTTFVALALTVFLLVLLRAAPTIRGSVASGLAYGALLFVNPAPMTLAPAVLVYVWRNAGGTRRALSAPACFAAAAFAVCAPWMLRNQLVLGAFSLRPNFGVEMRIGNHDEANGRPVPFRYHPSHVEGELALDEQLGEVAYARENTQRALEWIQTHPAHFAALTLRRVQIFWVGESPTTDPRRTDGLSPKGDPSSWIKFVAYALSGVAAVVGLFVVRMAARLRWLSAASFVLFGAPYYLSHVSERYRFPIDPWLILFGAALALALLDRVRGRAHG